MRKVTVFAVVIVLLILTGFFVNVVIAELGNSYYFGTQNWFVRLPVGVSQQLNFPVLSPYALDNYNYSNFLDPAVTTQVVSDSVYATLPQADPTFIRDMINSASEQARTDAALQAKAGFTTSHGLVDILGTFSPRSFADYAWHYHATDLVSAGIASSSDLAQYAGSPNGAAGVTPPDVLAAIQGNTALARQLSIQYQWGMPGQCQGPGAASVCGTGASNYVLPAARFWTNGALGVIAQEMAANGYGGPAIINAITSAGYDTGTAVAALAYANASPGTQYIMNTGVGGGSQGTGQGWNVDPAVYGPKPFVAQIDTNPAWAIIDTGAVYTNSWDQLVADPTSITITKVLNPQYGKLVIGSIGGLGASQEYIYAACGGSTACEQGTAAGHSYFTIPTDIVNQVGTDTVARAAGFVQNLAGTPNVNSGILIFASDATQNAWSSSDPHNGPLCAHAICETLATYQTNYDALVKVSAALNKWQAQHPDYQLHWGTVPINAAVPSFANNAQRMSIVEFYLTNAMMNPSAVLPDPTALNPQLQAANGQPVGVGVGGWTGVAIDNSGAQSYNPNALHAYAVYLLSSFAQDGWTWGWQAPQLAAFYNFLTVQAGLTMSPADWASLIKFEMAIRNSVGGYDGALMGVTLAAGLAQQLYNNDLQASKIPWNVNFAARLASCTSGKGCDLASKFVSQIAPSCVGCSDLSQYPNGYSLSNPGPDIAAIVGGYGPSYKDEWARVMATDAGTIKTLESFTTKAQYEAWYAGRTIRASTFSGPDAGSAFEGYLISSGIESQLAGPNCNDACIKNFADVLASGNIPVSIVDQYGKISVKITPCGKGCSNVAQLIPFPPQFIPVQSYTPVVKVTSWPAVIISSGALPASATTSPNIQLVSPSDPSVSRPLSLKQSFSLVDTFQSGVQGATNSVMYLFTIDLAGFPLVIAWYWTILLGFVVLILLILTVNLVRRRRHGRR